MVVISYSAIRNFKTKHAHAWDGLDNWYKITQRADWCNLHEVKAVFNSVDAIGNDLYVFNIKGNRFRLIARIIFPVRTVFIKFIGTHAEL